MKKNFLMLVLGMLAFFEAQELQPLAEGNNQFAVQLYQQLSKNSEQNLFFSPYSIFTAFAMTYAGARGETARQMENVLCFPQTEEALHQLVALLKASLEKNAVSGKFALNVANALWPAETLSLLPAFLETTKKYYSASVYPLNFGDSQEACNKINHWVEEKTQHKIKELLTPDVVNPATQLVLTNAIYFKGAWKVPFDPENTYPAPFWVTSEKSVEVPTMHLKNTKIPYMENDILQMIELPYAGDAVSMMILLPRPQKNWNAFEQSIQPESLKKWKEALHATKIPIALPKFKMTLRFSLADTLVQMGMTDAFLGGKANFSGIDGGHSLFISAVIHQAFVEVNEEGTEAAAATAITMEKSAALKNFNANRPFLFLIQETKTGNILFLGRMMNPSA